MLKSWWEFSYHVLAAKNPWEFYLSHDLSWACQLGTCQVPMKCTNVVFLEMKWYERLLNWRHGEVVVGWFYGDFCPSVAVGARCRFRSTPLTCKMAVTWKVWRSGHWCMPLKNPGWRKPAEIETTIVYTYVDVQYQCYCTIIIRFSDFPTTRSNPLHQKKGLGFNGNLWGAKEWASDSDRTGSLGCETGTRRMTWRRYLWDRNSSRRFFLFALSICCMDFWFVKGSAVDFVTDFQFRCLFLLVLFIDFNEFCQVLRLISSPPKTPVYYNMSRLQWRAGSKI